MISIIGLKPRKAIPAARPKIPFSEIGVCITWSGYLRESPFVTLNAQPYGSLISSPISILLTLVYNTLSNDILNNSTFFINLLSGL